MPGKINSRIETGLLYGLVFLIAVFWFEFRADSFDEERDILAPYFPVFYVLVIIAGALVASYLADSYLQDPSRWITLGSLAVPPVTVLVTASIIAAVGFTVFLHFAIRPAGDGEDIWGLISLTLNALSMSFFFIATSWHVLLIGLTAITSLLWFRHGQPESEK